MNSVEQLAPKGKGSGKGQQSYDSYSNNSSQFQGGYNNSSYGTPWQGAAWTPDPNRPGMLRVKEEKIHDDRFYRHDSNGSLVRMIHDDNSECVTWCTDIRGTNNGLELKRLGMIVAKIGENPSLNKIITKTMSDSLNLEFRSIDEFHEFMVEFRVLQKKYHLPQVSAMDWCKTNAEESGILPRTMQFDEPQRPNLMKNHKELISRELSANLTAPPFNGDMTGYNVGHVVPPPRRMASAAPVHT